jgi:SAM-dependent methyltransferase
MTNRFRDVLKSLLGPRRTTQLRVLARGHDLPRWGNLRRTQPFSTQFGFDRGTPVDRYYIERFFRKHAEYIQGDVLEIQSSGYTRRYGRDVRLAHSVDIDPRHQPTIVCDLADSASALPSARYDCFLLPSTPQHLRQPEAALRHALRVVKPGGTILATCAGLLPLIPDGPDYWHLSAAGWEEVTARVWSDCEVRVQSFGNCLSAVAAMLGLALEELTPAELDVNDPRYPVVVTLWCRKSAGEPT